MSKTLTALRAWSFSEFCRIAARDETDFDSFGTVVTQGRRSDEGSTYTFKDNGSDVLAVAHLDTVQKHSHASVIRCKGESVLLCPVLDDRLGVYIITRMLPRMGITCDWLLTTGEEVGMSSAENFIADKAYNWCFSFDRSGTDVVLYQHEHKKLMRTMRKAGFTVGMGSFSDISSLDIGCSGVNFGCGYYAAHDLHAYAKLSETFRMADRFAKFFHDWHAKRLPFDPASRYGTMSGWSRRAYHYGTGYGTRRDVFDERSVYCGRNGYHSVGYPENEVIVWRDDHGKWQKEKNGQFLDWYDPNDEHELQKAQDAALEELADEAIRTMEDNGQ